MSAYKVIYRQENNPQLEQHLPWEEGCPVSLSAVQISRNTTTSESFLQVKVINISSCTVLEIHAEAVVTYANNTTETVPLIDLDADVEAGDYYTFKAAALSQGDATHANVCIVKTRSSYGVWETSQQPTTVAWGEELALTAEQASARTAYLANAGCTDPSLAGRTACDYGTYWSCTCGQVNLTTTCARCKLNKQAAMQANESSFIDDLVKTRAAEAEEAKEKAQVSKAKRTRIISIAVCALAVAGVAYLIVTNIFPVGWNVTSGTIRGAYVVSKYTCTDSDGNLKTYEYELDEHGNVRKSTDTTDNSTSTYEYDNYGNVTKCSRNKYSYRQSVDSTDEYGQPTKITCTYDDGDSDTHEIEWYPGEGHVKRVDFSIPISDLLYTSSSYFNEEGEEIRNDALFDEPADSMLSDSRYYTDYTYEHDHDGKVISRTAKDEDGKVTTTEYVYDENGNVIKVIEDGKTVGTYEYTYVEDASPRVLMESNHFLHECGF